MVRLTILEIRCFCLNFEPLPWFCHGVFGFDPLFSAHRHRVVGARRSRCSLLVALCSSCRRPLFAYYLLEQPCKRRAVQRHGTHLPPTLRHHLSLFGLSDLFDRDEMLIFMKLFFPYQSHFLQSSMVFLIHCCILYRQGIEFSYCYVICGANY